MGVAFVLEELQLDTLDSDEPDQYGPLAGQVASAMKEACRHAFLAHSPRLFEPVFDCEVQVKSEMMGKVFAVLGQRRAEVYAERLKEGTTFFVINARLPVYSSFGFSESLMGDSSGEASTQLNFSGWRIVSQDPFFVPRSEEELEEHGANIGGNFTQLGSADCGRNSNKERASYSEEDC